MIVGGESSVMAKPAKKVAQTKRSIEPSEDQELIKKLVIAAFIIIGVALIVWLFATAAPEKQLICNGSSSLNGFGSCTLGD